MHWTRLRASHLSFLLSSANLCQLSRESECAISPVTTSEGLYYETLNRKETSLTTPNEYTIAMDVLANKGP